MRGPSGSAKGTPLMCGQRYPRGTLPKGKSRRRAARHKLPRLHGSSRTSRRHDFACVLPPPCPYWPPASTLPKINDTSRIREVPFAWRARHLLKDPQETPRPLPQSTAVDLRQGSTLRTSASINCQVCGPLFLVGFALTAVAPDLLIRPARRTPASLAAHPAPSLAVPGVRLDTSLARRLVTRPARRLVVPLGVPGIRRMPISLAICLGRRFGRTTVRLARRHLAIPILLGHRPSRSLGRRPPRLLLWAYDRTSRLRAVLSSPILPTSIP
ncbi:hypothetical protein K488DRAFT_92727 [Vararia minispora EC-137]|uniref:Uncharacterized protein n=1 Tax=Vararia minispora EC-137 TaxID=1314806 RepID=A0ACB8Q3R4_9AGAM|nr:hypothetical protein K488DRAFT_92727 [Vararia minispora EC-137]